MFNLELGIGLRLKEEGLRLKRRWGSSVVLRLQFHEYPYLYEGFSWEITLRKKRIR